MIPAPLIEERKTSYDDFDSLLDDSGAKTRTYSLDSKTTDAGDMFNSKHTKSKSVTGGSTTHVKRNLMDMNEILSLDVMAMAMETTA